MARVWFENKNGSFSETMETIAIISGDHEWLKL